MSTVESGVRKVACRALLSFTVTALHPFRAITQQRRRHASSEDIIPQSSAIPDCLVWPSLELLAIFWGPALTNAVKVI
jgi:hypothetical protein